MVFVDGDGNTLTWRGRTPNRDGLAALNDHSRLEQLREAYLGAGRDDNGEQSHEEEGEFSYHRAVF